MAPKNRKAGRFSKLTPEVAQIITDSVRGGVPHKYAAERAGVGERTLQRWIAQGRRAKTGPPVALLASLKKAEADAVAASVAQITYAGMPHNDVTVKETWGIDSTTGELVMTERVTTTRRVFEWQALAWKLERSHPEEFGSNKREIRDLAKRLVEQERQIQELEGLLRDAASRNSTTPVVIGPGEGAASESDQAAIASSGEG